MNFTLPIFILIASAVFFFFDIVLDIKEGESTTHWLMEGILFLFIIFTLCNEIYSSNKLKKKVRSNEKELSSLKGEIADTIKQQFFEWSLSKAESEIAWLIIKGFSFSEISTLRLVNEKTVRKQAGHIYKKASVSNRSEFTASFLEDLLTK